jgi:hypothetical protein
MKMCGDRNFFKVKNFKKRSDADFSEMIIPLLFSIPVPVIHPECFSYQPSCSDQHEKNRHVLPSPHEFYDYGKKHS